MVIVCPSCRAPSNVAQSRCWVCQRRFDGSEPRIGRVPYTRRPSHVTRLEFDDGDDEIGVSAWISARPALSARYR
jgi:hypothetical protein